MLYKFKKICAEQNPYFNNKKRVLTFRSNNTFQKISRKNY